MWKKTRPERSKSCVSKRVGPRDEDDAEAILLGCAGFTQFADELERELEIPVLDGVVCAVKMAESLVELGKTTSKYKTYRPPEKKAYTGIFKHFDARRVIPSPSMEGCRVAVGWVTPPSVLTHLSCLSSSILFDESAYLYCIYAIRIFHLRSQGAILGNHPAGASGKDYHGFLSWRARGRDSSVPTGTGNDRRASRGVRTPGPSSSSKRAKATAQGRGETRRRTQTLSRRARHISVAYVDTSALVSIAFNEHGWTSLARRLDNFSHLLSSNLLRSGVTRSVCTRGN